MLSSHTYISAFPTESDREGESGSEEGSESEDEDGEEEGGEDLQLESEEGSEDEDEEELKEDNLDKEGEEGRAADAALTSSDISRGKSFGKTRGWKSLKDACLHVPY